MRLKRDGLLARLYFFSLSGTNGQRHKAEASERYGTDLCSVAQRVCVGLPLQVLGTLAGVVSVSLFVFWVFCPSLVDLGFLLWDNPLAAVAMTGLIAVGVLVVGLPRFWDYMLDLEAVAAAREWAKAKKGRYCPRVEFVARVERP